jgi:DNA polymerase-3 subunit beta
MALVKPENKADTGDIIIDSIDAETASVKVDGLTTKLTAIPIDDYPDTTNQHEDWSLVALWDAKTFASALKFVLPAICKDETRPHICCLAFTEDGKAASTDGHRLHLASLPGPVDQPILIPTDSALLLNRILKDGQVIIARTETHVKIRSGAYELTTKLVDAEFPPWEQVVPANNETTLTVDTKAFAKALKKVGTLSQTKSVRVTVNGVITLSSSDPEAGEASIEFEPIESNHSGEDTVFGINVPFLIDALGKGKETATISMDGPLDPIRIDIGDTCTGVVMPMRV